MWLAYCKKARCYQPQASPVILFPAKSTSFSRFLSFRLFGFPCGGWEGTETTINGSSRLVGVLRSDDILITLNPVASTLLDWLLIPPGRANRPVLPDHNNHAGQGVGAALGFERITG